MASADAKKRKTWPAFASWVQEWFQANQDETISKPLALDPALYLVATPIGNLGDMTLRGLWVLRNADIVLCEDTRITGGLLHHYGIKKQLLTCHDHNEAERQAEILRRLAEGQAIALVSDAGTPLISDPGYKLVQACRAAGHSIVPVPGACAAITALTFSGLPSDRFMFIGFLPPKQAARQEVLKDLAQTQATLIFYESPQRLKATLADLCQLYGPERPAAVGRELTKLYEDMQSATLGELAAFYEQDEIKGEIVLLIGPSTQEAPKQDLDAALRQALETMSIRDAATAVSGALGLKKSVVYQRALDLSRGN